MNETLIICEQMCRLERNIKKATNIKLKAVMRAEFRRLSAQLDKLVKDGKKI